MFVEMECNQVDCPGVVGIEVDLSYMEYDVGETTINLQAPASEAVCPICHEQLREENR